MKTKLHKLIEQELYRRARIQVQARRISLAENLIVEKVSKDKIKQQIRNLIQKAEDANDDGNDKLGDSFLKQADALGKQHGLDLEDIKSKLEPKDTPEPKKSMPNQDDNSDEDTEDKEDAVGGVADKAQPMPDEDDEDDDGPTIGGSTSGPSMPKDGSADESIQNGDVTYQTQGSKLGQKDTSAIPQAWFEKWLERSKHPISKLKTMLSNAQAASRELTPPRTEDKDRIKRFRETQSGYQNKIKALQNVLRDLQKRDNEEIDNQDRKSVV